MIEQNQHISDAELLQAMDGELSRDRSAAVRSHCENCWSCRARKASIEAAIVEFTNAQRQTLDPQLPPVAGPRALLKARLATQADPRQAPVRPWLLQRAAVLTAACVSLLAVTVAAVAWNNSRAIPVEAGSIPDRSLTPGMTRPVSISEVCSMPHEEVVREVPVSLREQVLEEYGISAAHPGDYEIDYLIAPGLGGAEDIRNLWPQPYKSHEWNARVKDDLEERLHQLVCSRQLSLETAQREIATDWIAAYKKYFHAEKPPLRWSISG